MTLNEPLPGRQERVLLDTMPTLHGFSPWQVASLIRALDSRLVRIDYDDHAGEPILQYHFEVAGKTQTFPITVKPETLISIGDLYAEAVAYEQDLSNRLGLVFRPPAGEMSTAREAFKLIMYDITLKLTSELPTFPGEPGMSLEPVHRIARGGPANVSKLCFGTHTGTHVDAPEHFFDNAATVADLPLDVLIGPVIVSKFDVPRAITASDLDRANLPPDMRRVLFKTSNSALLHQRDFNRDFVYIDPSAAHWLVDRGVRLVGLDYLSVEGFGHQPAETHQLLLKASVVIIEGLDLLHARPGAYTLICLPLRVQTDGCPVRALLLNHPLQ